MCSKYVYTTILIFRCANYNRRGVKARAFSESTCVCRSTSCHDIYFWFYVKYINEIVPVYSLDIAREILLYTFLFVQTYSRDRYVCVYVCTYVYTYVCIYVHTIQTFHLCQFRKFVEIYFSRTIDNPLAGFLFILFFLFFFFLDS